MVSWMELMPYIAIIYLYKLLFYMNSNLATLIITAIRGVFVAWYIIRFKEAK